MSRVARILLAVLILLGGQAWAQKGTPAKPPADEASRLAQDYAFDAASTRAAPSAGQTEDESKRFHEYRMQQQKDKVTFAILLGVVALVAHLIALGFLYQRAPEHVVSATGLIYIVFGTILLVVIANTEAQLTAAIGILGAIAGYLFGKLQRKEGEEAPPPAQALQSPPGGTTG